MKEIKRFIVEDGDHPTKYVVHKEGDNLRVRAEYNHGYFSQLDLDDNSNAVYTSESGSGKCKIKIPGGAIFDIPIMMYLLNLCEGSNIFGEHRVYTEEVGSLFRKDK